MLNELAEEMYQIAKSKGFHDKPVPVGTMCINGVGEWAELWEAHRRGLLNSPCDKDIGLTCAEEELADILIRTLDTAHELGIDLDRAVRVKSIYNAGRPYRNGGKCE